MNIMNMNRLCDFIFHVYFTERFIGILNLLVVRG